MRVECGGEGVVLEFQPSVSVTVSGVRRTCRESLPIVLAVSNHIRGRPRESFNISARKWPFGCGERGGWGRNRTGDTRIFSPLLYQLSYPAARMLTKAEIAQRSNALRIFWATPPRVATFSNSAPSKSRSRRTAPDGA